MVNMAHCVCLDTLTQAGRAKLNANSICWDCGVKTGKCTWLTERKPYPGSVYWRNRVTWQGTDDIVYIMVDCPWYQNKEV